MRKNDIEDDEIRIIGEATKGNAEGRRWNPWKAAVVALTLAAVVMSVWFVAKGHGTSSNNTGQVDDRQDVTTEDASVNNLWLDNSDDSGEAYTEISDTTVREVRLRLFTPRNCRPELVVGELDTHRHSLVMAVQAADIRKDNGGIVGAFVMKGVPLAWGLSKSGYCAIIKGRMCVGVAENSPFFEQATETEGYFFRQYALVDHGHVVPSNLENKAIRRALCNLYGEAVVVESQQKILMDDFSEALVALGASEAIYLVGGSTFQMAKDADQIHHITGQLWSHKAKNVNYLVFLSE
ncbi:MAG: hypothetical protein IJ620_02050 [Bacteroidales bacterium]|nr:hypothetical protein [Bacteroidales bacterium]